MGKPRLTNAVRDGWAEIRSLITCELENAQVSQFECREATRRIAESGDPDADPPNPETCLCEGCTATRNAWAAVAWIDARLSTYNADG